MYIYDVEMSQSRFVCSQSTTVRLRFHTWFRKEGSIFIDDNNKTHDESNPCLQLKGPIYTLVQIIVLPSKVELDLKASRALVTCKFPNKSRLQIQHILHAAFNNAQTRLLKFTLSVKFGQWGSKEYDHAAVRERESASYAEETT